MAETIDIMFNNRPPVFSLYVKGLLSGHPELKSGETVPEMKAELRGFTINEKHLQKYQTTCGLDPAKGVPALYPHMIMFPFHMSIVGHPRFPFLYLNMIQVKNYTLQHRKFSAHEKMDVCCKIISQRITEKGMEINIHSTLKSGDEMAWENVNTYFFKGKYGTPEVSSPVPTLNPIDGIAEERTWKTPSGGGWNFSRLSSDYNGIHYMGFYARMLGFRKDFAHGQATVAHCIRHLPDIDNTKPVRIETALKGPVYYSSNVRLKYLSQGGYRFDLYCKDNPRPSICGDIKNIDRDSSLLDSIL